MVACGGSSTHAAPPAVAVAAASDEATAGLIEHHRYHHHGGVTLFIAMSLDTLGVLPEEKAAIEKIRTRLHDAMNPALAAEQSLVVALADGLDVGTIDIARVDADVAQVAAAASALAGASADALNDLHAILTPIERLALVEKVESHWVVWQQANSERGGSPNPEPDHVESVATDLGLTPDQVGRIRGGLGEEIKPAFRFSVQEVKTNIRAFGDAFESERFDARSLPGASEANDHVAGWGASHLARFVETVNPVLTQEQRVMFAQRVREHATHNPSAQGNL